MPDCPSRNSFLCTLFKYDTFKYLLLLFSIFGYIPVRKCKVVILLTLLNFWSSSFNSLTHIYLLAFENFCGLKELQIFYFFFHMSIPQIEGLARALLAIWKMCKQTLTSLQWGGQNGWDNDRWTELLQTAKRWTSCLTFS